MTAQPRDYSILDKLNLERKPVGVKFLSIRPKGIARIAKSLSFCEMFKEAQTAPPFYVQREDLHCIEPLILGMEDAHPYLNGEINMTVSGLGYSMKARGVLPDGLLIITVPFDLLSGLIDNLKDMEWEPYWFKLGRDNFIKEVKKRSGEIEEALAKD
ncbi:MAG: DUF169 domain-containing protein [Dehalococcoidia bacterium]|jgi:hypothetical protein